MIIFPASPSRGSRNISPKHALPDETHTRLVFCILFSIFHFDGVVWFGWWGILEETNA